MANNSAQYDVRLAFSADVAQARQQLKSLQDELSKLSTLKDVNVGTRLTKELEQASLKAADLKVMLEKATDINTGKLNLTSFSNQLTKNGESLSTYRKALSALGPQGEEAFLQLTQSVITADAALTTGSKKLNDFKKTLANTVKWQISSNITHGIMGELQTAYYYAKDLDRALTDIKIVTEDSAGSMANFAEKANKAAQALSTTTKDYAQASLIYYQQGLNDKEVEARTAVTIKMANAAGESASKVSDQLTAVWNNFYDGSKSLEYYADVMTKLGAYTASSTDEISEGIQKFASVANTIGLSYEYATSALATLTAKTRESANTVGNSLKTLFARIQGLTLGETLEDGTDLNKYSKALEKVGISIKDQQGELKDMNTILDEMMNKWDSLSRAEQVALAQTVGGVRQYTQLVNLMENKDYFKELVGVAENSEGTLQLQADIYAKSWEGARKRVQAAAEGIYDSLIDEEFFKDVDNIVAGVLNGINATIKGLGGVKGVLANVGALLTNIYKKDLSSGLSAFGNMIYGLTSKGQAAIENRRQEALNEQKKIYTLGMEELGSSIWERGNNSEDISRYSSYEKLAEIEQKLLNISKDLTEEEQKKAGLYLDQLKAVQDREITMGRILDQNRNSLQRAAIGFTAGINTGSEASDQADRQRVNQVTNTYDEMVGIAKIAGTINQVRTGETFDSQNQQSRIKDVKLMQSMVDRMQELGNSANFQFAKDNSKSLEDLSIKLQGLIKDLEQGTSSADKFNEALKDMKIISRQGAFGKVQHNDNGEPDVEVAGAKQEAQDVVSGINAAFNLPNQTETYLQQLDGLEENTQQYIQTNHQAQMANEQVGESFDQMALKVASTSDKIVAIGGALMSFSSLSTSISGLFNIFNNNSLSNIEKAIGLMTSLGMIISNGINIYKRLNTVMTASNLIQQAQNIINKQNASGLSGLIAQIGYKVLAHKSSTAAMTAEAVAATGLKLATGSLTAIIGIAVMGITALVQAEEKRKEKLKEAAQQTQEQVETLQEEYEANEKIVQSYEDALDVYQKTGDGKSELISVGQQLIDVYNIENGTLLLLTEQYEKLAEAAREAAKAEAERIAIQSEIAYTAQTETNENEIDGLSGNNSSGYKYDTVIDADMSQEYLRNNPNNKWWVSKIYDTKEEAISPKNFVNYYDQVVQGLVDFEAWAKDAGYTAEQISEATKGARQFLADNKTIYETNKNVNDTYRNSQLEVGYLSQDFSKISSVSDFAEKQKNIANSTGFTTEEVNAYLAQKTGLSDYAMLDNAVRQFAEASGWNVDKLYSQLDEEQLKAVINLTPEMASHDIESLIKQIEDYNKTHPVDISLSLKKAKKDLKDEMSDKDWQTFWEDTTDITWGSNGIVSQQTFQDMLPEQRTAYLNKLSQNNYTDFTPEAIQNRQLDEQSIYENNIQNLQQNKANEIAQLYHPGKVGNDDWSKDYTTYQSYLDKLNTIKDIAPEFYEEVQNSLKDLSNGTIDSEEFREGLRWGYQTNDSLIEAGFTLDDISNLSDKGLLDTYNAVEKYNKDKLAIETKYDELTKEEQEKIKESQRQTAQDIGEYWTQTSNTVTKLSKSDLNIGDIIQPEQYDRLKTLGVDVDKYFIQMEDGTYKLITAAEEFNQTIGNLSIEHAYDRVDQILNKLYGKDSKFSIEEQRNIAVTRANDYLNYSEEQLKKVPDDVKEDYINTMSEAMDINPEELTGTLEEKVLTIASKFVSYINDAEYRINVTIQNASSMTELENLAIKAGWSKTDKKYTDAILNYQAEKGNGLGRDEAIEVWTDAQKKQDIETEIAQTYEVEAQALLAMNDSTLDDNERVKAEDTYNESLNKRKALEKELNDIDNKLANSTETLTKKLKKSDFSNALKNMNDYIKALKQAKKNTDDYEKACNNIATALSKAFNTTVTNDFVKKHKNIIEQMVNPNGTEASRQEGANTVGLQLSIDTEQAKGELTDKLQEINNSIDVDSIFSNLQKIKLDAEGHIVMTGDSGSAVAAIGKVISGLGSGEEQAKMLATLLNAILGTNIDFEADMEPLIAMAKAMTSEDPNALVEWSEKYPDFSANLKTTASSLAPDLEGWPGLTSNKNSGGGGSKKSTAEIGKSIQDERLKTYEKKRELLETKRDGANPDDAAKYIKEEIDLLEEEQDILEDQIKSWKKLLKLKVEEFNKDHPEFEIKLTDDGEIANASELWGKVWAEYEKNLENGMSKEELNEWFTKIKEGLDGPMGIQQSIDENVALIAQKEKEQAELELEAITKAIDWKVKQIDFQIKRLNYYQEKLLKQAHGNKQTIEAMLEGFAYQEQEMLQLFDKGAALREGIDQLNTAKAKYPEYEQMFDEQILEYQSELIDVNEAILDLRGDIEDLVQNVLDLALDEIDKQIDRLDTYTSMLDHLNNIIDLSGRSMLDMGLKTQIGATKVETMVGKMKSLKAQMDGLTKATKEAQAALADRQADGDTSSVKFWENQVEVLKQETEKASDEFLASWEETLEAAQDLFEMRVGMAVNILSNALSPFETLEDFQDKYEKAKTINEEYLNDAERLYELNKLNRQLNLQLADANDLLAKQKLKDIQQEIHDLQADGVQMSQYDLEYLQKKYDLQLAEIALMEQQNSKTSMRLVRDAAGNWTYAYDADEEKIEDATQKYEDAVHELGQLSKDYINDVSEQLIQNQIDFKEALQDLDKNSADYSNQLLSLQEYYVERQRYLLDELNKGVVNSGLTFHDTLYGQMTDLYDYNDAYTQFVNNSNTTISELQTNYKDWQKVVETAMGVAGTSWDNFGTDMGGTLDSLEEHIQKLCDEIEKLVNVLMSYISQSIGMVLDWEQKYSKRTDEELAKNEQYIDGNFASSGSERNTVGVDLSALALKMQQEGLDYIYDQNGNKYDSIEDILNERNRKLDNIANELKNGSSSETWGEEEGKWISENRDQDWLIKKLKEEGWEGDYGGGAAIGAYTGNWGPGQGLGPDNGKIIKVHPKELILNQKDTSNILRAVDIVRNMNDWIDKQVQSMVDFGQAKLGSLIDKTTSPVYETQPIKQEVTIQADFPGVTDHYEIEEALSNLSNNAAQYISANKSK